MNGEFSMPKPINKNLRTDLLQAAILLLDTRGDTHFSMKELAAQVDYSVTAVYRCFEHKTHLLQALQLHLFEQLPHHLFPILSQLHSIPSSDHVKQSDTTPMSRVVQIRAIGAAFIKWGVEHPARYHFMFHTTQAGSLLTAENQAKARLGMRLLEQLIQEGIEEGEFIPQDPTVSATLLFASLHGLISLYTAQRLDSSHITDLSDFYDTYVADWMSKLLLAQG